MRFNTLVQTNYETPSKYVLYVLSVRDVSNGDVCMSAVFEEWASPILPGVFHRKALHFQQLSQRVILTVDYVLPLLIVQLLHHDVLTQVVHNLMKNNKQGKHSSIYAFIHLTVFDSQSFEWRWFVWLLSNIFKFGSNIPQVMSL